MKKYWLSLLILILLAVPFLIPMGQAGATPIATGVVGEALSVPDAPDAPDSCSPPVTQNLRGKDVDLDQCYQLNFSYGGTNYTVDVYYTETDTATNLGRCDASDYAGRCEHKLANVDTPGGDNQYAVDMANEAADAMRFYKDRNLPFLWSGSTLTIYIAEDPRGGGTPTCNSILVDDEWVEGNDILKKRLLAIHEMQHLIQCHYQPTPGWDGFYGEGIARSVEDRYEPTLDADTGHLFIPEINGILGSDAVRSSDLTTNSYTSAAWWTWLLDQYTTGSEIEPVQGWHALSDFYTPLSGAASTLTSLKSFISGKGSTFRRDFTDYSLALYAYRFTNSDARVDFRDTEINNNSSGLSGPISVSGGPSYASHTLNMNPRSVRYIDFNPASQCDFIGFDFDGRGKSYSFSVLLVNNANNLANRWTNFGPTWSRTIATSTLNRVAGVVTAIDDSGPVDVSYGCLNPTINIKSPTAAAFDMVGTAADPRNFVVRLHVEGADGSPVAGLTSDDFEVALTKTSTGSPTIAATILSSAYVQDDYWLLVRSPRDTDGAEDGQFYDLGVRLGSASDSESGAILYVPRAQDVMVVLDSSGSMGGTSGRIEAARNAASLLVDELADSDRGGYVNFDTSATLRQALDTLNSGGGSHRQAILNDILVEPADGLTAIGPGMLRAQQEYHPKKDPSRQCSFVLLSDGHENVTPYWDDPSVKPLVSAEGCPIHVVALGPSANETLLQHISTAVTGGSYDYADSAGTVPAGPQSADAPLADMSWQNNLSRIYDYKAIQIAGRQRLQTVLALEPQKANEYQFEVDETSTQVVVSIAWQNAQDGQIVQILDPNGVPIPVGVLGPDAGPSAVRRFNGTHEVWELHNVIPGKYTLKIAGIYQQFFVSVSADSDYQLYLFIGSDPENGYAGQHVPILAMLVGPDGAIKGATVVASVRDAAGVSRNLLLQDDGNHGDGMAGDGVYGGVYRITPSADAGVITPPTDGEEPTAVGSYQVKVVATWDNFRREAQGSFAVPPSEDSDGNRLPDAWEKANGVFGEKGDLDGDGLDSLCEFRAGTDPRNSDTDGGGESDGSEVPQCFVDPNGQDPFDPSDDRVGSLGDLNVRPELDLNLRPYIRIWWGDPLLGKLISTDIFRRVISPTQGMTGDWVLLSSGLDGTQFDDRSIDPGTSYQYRITPTVDPGTGPLQAATETSAVVVPKTDPYPPGGSVLINGGAGSTTSRNVTMEIAADDLFGENDGAPPVEPLLSAQASEIPHTPAANLMMRISNSPDFSGVDWQPYQEKLDWDLGDVPAGTQATVYVQFKDEAGNVGDSGFQQMDTILYNPPFIYLPMVQR